MIEEKSIDIVKLELSQYLEAKGHRKTPERFAILEKIYTMGEHFEVETLYELMSHTEYRVSKATVYNTIDLLVEAGLVRKHQFGNHPAQYEKSYNMANHHHLICIKCGKVQEVNEVDDADILARKEFKKFSSLYYALYIYGKCNSCVRAERRKQLRNNK